MRGCAEVAGGRAAATHKGRAVELHEELLGDELVDRVAICFLAIGNVVFYNLVIGAGAVVRDSERYA